MLLTYNEISKLLDAGVVEHALAEHINAASLDVTLGPCIWTENSRSCVVDLAKKENANMDQLDIEQLGEFNLMPGEFVLAQTREVFNLPNDLACEFRLKSSAARNGLDQALAVWCDPGWNGSVLTMELRNNYRYHPLRLTPGMKIGQMVFFRGEPVPQAQSYAVRGQYNGDILTTQSKGIR